MLEEGTRHLALARHYTGWSLPGRDEAADLFIVCANREFRVRKSVLTPTRLFIRPYPHGIEELKPNHFSMASDDPGAVQAMLRFFHIGDYYDYDSNSRNRTILAFHVAVYALGTRYGLTALTALAHSRFEAGIQTCCGRGLKGCEFRDGVESVYSFSLGSSLGKMAAGRASNHLNEIKEEKWLKSVPGFAAELAQRHLQTEDARREKKFVLCESCGVLVGGQVTHRAWCKAQKTKMDKIDEMLAELGFNSPPKNDSPTVGPSGWTSPGARDSSIGWKGKMKLGTDAKMKPGTDARMSPKNS